MLGLGLIAVVPDGGDVAAVVAAEEHCMGQSLAGYQTQSDLALVDAIPTGATVFWRGHGMGWIKDETGRAWRYAVIPSAKPYGGTRTHRRHVPLGTRLTG
jgi:hypothetical protein